MTKKRYSEKPLNYETVYLKNPRTDGPYTLKTSQQKIFELQSTIKLFELGKPVFARNRREMIVNFELTLFPSFDLILRKDFLGLKTGQVLKQVLTNFDLDIAFIERILENERFVDELIIRFEIVRGSEHEAISLMKLLYCRIMVCFSGVYIPPIQIFRDFDAIEEFYGDDFFHPDPW